MSVALDKARDLRAARIAKRRESERADAWDFLVHGDEDGRHAETCVHAQACGHDAGCQREACRPCSRDYDPMPYFESAPQPARIYAGTGIGALYGLPDTERHLWQLAGWNVAIAGSPREDIENVVHYDAFGGVDALGVQVAS